MSSAPLPLDRLAYVPASSALVVMVSELAPPSRSAATLLGLETEPTGARTVGLAGAAPAGPTLLGRAGALPVEKPGSFAISGGIVANKPIALDDHYATLAGEALNITAPGFLANDIDLDGESLTATSLVDNVDHGSLAAFADGSFTYTPDPGFVGTDSFAYRMRDASNNFSDPGTVTIQVVEGNRAPVGFPDLYTALAGTTLNVAASGFLANDIDLDGESLTATSLVDNVDHGSLAAFADGSFTYTPDPGFVGTDSFAYRMRDASNNFSDPITVTLTVIVGNRPPVGTEDHYTVRAGVSTSIPASGFLRNDIDPDGEALTAVSIQDNVDHGSLAAFADGSFTYTPDPGFVGTDSFAYRMRDASNNFSDPITVTLTVIVGNRPPVGTEDHYTVRAGVSTSIPASGFLRNDIDPDGEALTAVSIQDNVDHGSLAAFADGSFTYTPDPGFVGTDSFAYRMRDASNNFSDPITVTLTVIVGNRAPVGAEDHYSAVVNTTLNITASGFLRNDIDPDGEALTAVSIQDNVDHGSLAAFADGSFTYTPDPGFVGTDSFAYRMRDASNNFSDPITVTIEVLQDNRSPLAIIDLYGAIENITINIPAAWGFTANDIDPDGDFVTAVAIVDNVDHGLLIAFADGSFTYTPDLGFFGTDSFVYRVSDGHGGFAEGTVTIEVFSPNDPPIAVDDAYVVNAGSALMVPAVIGVLNNDTDPDGDPFAASLVTGPANGTLVFNSDGSFTYTPNAGFTGSDSFTYLVNDGFVDSNLATVTLNVQAVASPLVVSSFVVNNGNIQRSSVHTLSVRFNQNTNLAALIAGGGVVNAVQLFNSAGAQIPLAAARYFYNVVSFTLTVDVTVDGFGGSAATMLANGDFQLRLNVAAITNAAGNAVLVDNDGLLDGVRRHNFHRLDGDYDGSRAVNILDLDDFYSRFGTTLSSPKYDAAWDRNGDGVVNILDYLSWKLTVGLSL